MASSTANTRPSINANIAQRVHAIVQSHNDSINEMFEDLLAVTWADDNKHNRVFDQVLAAVEASENRIKDMCGDMCERVLAAVRENNEVKETVADELQGFREELRTIKEVLVWQQRMTVKAQAKPSTDDGESDDEPLVEKRARNLKRKRKRQEIEEGGDGPPQRTESRSRPE